MSGERKIAQFSVEQQSVLGGAPPSAPGLSLAHGCVLAGASSLTAGRRNAELVEVQDVAHDRTARSSAMTRTKPFMSRIPLATVSSAAPIAVRIICSPCFTHATGGQSLEIAQRNQSAVSYGKSSRIRQQDQRRLFRNNHCNVAVTTSRITNANTRNHRRTCRQRSFGSSKSFQITIRIPNTSELLTLACEAWDRGVQAREALAEHGLTFLDRFGSPHAHPCVAIEHDFRIAFARQCRELDLDADAIVMPTRPPALTSNRRN